jgi:ABC-2 type transport system ATP-binding protein
MIKVEQLTKKYRKATAVDGISFTVTPGHVTGFLGPNGAGKSTTMRMILGLDTPTSGSVSINGQTPRSLAAPLRTIGAMLDAKAADPGRTATNHLRWLAHSNGLSTGRIAEVLDLVGLTDVASRRVGTFSLGMSQRLGIAAALLGDPQIVMFDEPINGLDPDGILWIRSFMKALAAQGRAVFLSSHLMSEMAVTADHLIVIGRGTIIADGPINDIVQRHATASVHVAAARLGDLQQLLADRGACVQRDATSSNLVVTAMDAATIGRVAQTNGIALTELTTQAPSLEDAFLQLTAESTDYRAAALVGAGKRA